MSFTLQEILYCIRRFIEWWSCSSVLFELKFIELSFHLLRYIFFICKVNNDILLILICLYVFNDFYYIFGIWSLYYIRYNFFRKRFSFRIFLYCNIHIKLCTGVNFICIAHLSVIFYTRTSSEFLKKTVDDHRSSLKTGLTRSGNTWPGFLKMLQQLIHVNLSNYFFRTYSVVLISIICSLFALYFMHKITESS